MSKKQKVAKSAEVLNVHLAAQEVNVANDHVMKEVIEVIEMSEVIEANVLAENDQHQEQIKVEVLKEVAAKDHTKIRIYD